MSFGAVLWFLIDANAPLHFVCANIMLGLPVPTPQLEIFPGGGGVGGGEALPSTRLMGMCRCMGLYFHEWIDYNGVAFSIELLEWGRIFSKFWSKNILASSKFGY